jgi:hypothetical protein
MRLGIALLSGLFGRFDFMEARNMFELVSESKRGSTQFAIVLRDSLSMSGCAIQNATDFAAIGSIFSFLRTSVDESIPLIRILNSHLCDWDESEDQIFEAWKVIARLSIEYLLDLSQSESNPASSPVHSNQLDQSPILRSLPTDLLSCNSISQMTSLVFTIYSIECSLYKNVNHFLRCFPMRVVGKFMKELRGILHYIYLVQSSIEYCSHNHPLVSNMTVYRAIQQRGNMLVPLYESMIGEVIVWPGFTSTSTDRDFVISTFIHGEDSLLFEISLHPGDAAVAITDCSDHPDESEILIAASSGFTIDDVEWIDIRRESGSGFREFKIAQVRLSYLISWYDLNIDELPAPVLV